MFFGSDWRHFSAIQQNSVPFSSFHCSITKEKAVTERQLQLSVTALWDNISL
ncbi:hypothetical protein HMPREF9372_2946 [Sporosarcina newyorkensis 2681]|uniref:Uncharacterized protein n=1 Tax=Sporosarcina newyorkensis 2681 TaxID=1027292 RepID=F9DVW5_9BACL|nr:hypothetical protein HMPREF9372_2946 [Sporosarcina newyorkensis 2681]